MNKIIRNLFMVMDEIYIVFKKDNVKNEDKD